MPPEQEIFRMGLYIGAGAGVPFGLVVGIVFMAFIEQRKRRREEGRGENPYILRGEELGLTEEMLHRK